MKACRIYGDMDRRDRLARPINQIANKKNRYDEQDKDQDSICLP